MLGPFKGMPSADEAAFQRFQESIDPAWIDAALDATGSATLRRRRLPVEQVVWLVLGMALYRHRPIDDLVGRLDLVLPHSGPSSVAKSAIAQARTRLGVEPLTWLFERCAEKWAHESGGDDLVELETSREARRQNPELPKTWTMRAIGYRRRGFRPQTLLTSLLDPKAFPADERRELYHERWELELGFDEVKTDLLERQEAIRSKTPKGVLQELWAVGLAYNLVRLEMQRIAKEADVPPSRISFVVSLRMICDEWLWAAATNSPGAIPKNLQRLRDELKRFILPPRRSMRSFPRAVKIKMSSYDRKRPATVRKAPHEVNGIGFRALQSSTRTPKNASPPATATTSKSASRSR